MNLFLLELQRSTFNVVLLLLLSEIVVNVESLFNAPVDAEFDVVVEFMFDGFGLVFHCVTICVAITSSFFLFLPFLDDFFFGIDFLFLSGVFFFFGGLFFCGRLLFGGLFSFPAF